jgi:hypothetical protein
VWRLHQLRVRVRRVRAEPARAGSAVFWGLCCAARPVVKASPKNKQCKQKLWDSQSPGCQGHCLSAVTGRDLPSPTGYRFSSGGGIVVVATHQEGTCKDVRPALSIEPAMAHGTWHWLSASAVAVSCELRAARTTNHPQALRAASCERA